MGRHSLPDDHATRPNGDSSQPHRRRTVAIATMLVLAVAAGTAVAAHGGLLSFSKSCEESAVRLSMMTSPAIAPPCVQSPTRLATTRSGPTGAASTSRSSPAIRTRSPMRSPPAPASRTTGSGCPTPSSAWTVPRARARTSRSRPETPSLPPRWAFAHNAARSAAEVSISSTRRTAPRCSTTRTRWSRDETEHRREPGRAAVQDTAQRGRRAAHPGEARLQGDRRDDRAGAGHIGRRQGTPAVHHFIRHSPVHRGRPGDARHVDDHGAERTADRGRRCLRVTGRGHPVTDPAEIQAVILQA